MSASHVARFVALLAAFVGAVPAWGAPESKVRGKTLSAWLRELGRKKEEAVEDALSALGDCRFLVDAPDRVLPALAPFLDGKRGRLGWWARECAARYGPLAGGVLDRLDRIWLGLDERGGAPGLEGSVFLARVGDPQQVGKGLENASRAFAREVGRAKARTTQLFNAMTTVAKLGVRGEAAAALVRDRIVASGKSDVGTLMWVAQDLGPASGALEASALAALDDEDAVIRERAVSALVWLELGADALRRTLAAARRNARKSAHPRAVVRGLCLTPHADKEAVLEYLRDASRGSDRGVSTWALAALARLDAQPARHLKALLVRLSDRDPDARAAAADGLWTLGKHAESAWPGLERALEDPDLRVRWRAAAALLAAGRPPDALLSELARGIDSPDDVDRMECFAAIARLGAVAKPLRERLAPWVAFPVKRIADAARRASEGLE